MGRGVCAFVCVWGGEIREERRTEENREREGERERERERERGTLVLLRPSRDL